MLYNLKKVYIKYLRKFFKSTKDEACKGQKLKIQKIFLELKNITNEKFEIYK